ncbi:MAG: DEAD/DEAH box helicase [Nitriliruptoraceae bacterium]
MWIHNEATINTDTARTSADPEEFLELAQAQLDGVASDADVARLESDPAEWVDALRRLRGRIERKIERLDGEVTGPERELVLNDFEHELERIDARLRELDGGADDATDDAHVETTTSGGNDGGASADGEREQAGDERRSSSRTSDDGDRQAGRQATRTPQLQLSWSQGRIIAWAGGRKARPAELDEVRERLAAAGAPAGPWEPDEALKLPGGDRAATVSAPVQEVLGWLVSLGGTAEDRELGPSVTWIGLAADLAVRLVGYGRMVPQLRKVGDAPANRSYFAVRWEPTLIDQDELNGLARSMPGAVAAADRQRDPQTVVRSVVTGFVDAICRDAAARIEVPAPPPNPQKASEVAENTLARLDGSTFEAPHQQGTEIRKGLKSWAGSVTGTSKLTLTVQLDPPDEDDAWLLRTLTSDGRRQDEPVEAAMSRANHARKEALKRELERLEGLYEPLMRGKDTRRGQVILSQDEAWELMSSRGQVLQAAGFEVRVPPMSRRKATPSLRVTSTQSQEAAVGARQLNDVRWSAVFDDVELTAEDIARLARESRPLVRSQGQWVELDHADLDAAAQALEERQQQTQLTGAQMLRYALGLEGTEFGRPVSLAGEGWATELLRSAQEIPEHPPTSPEGFEGQLRGYQADALAWLGFLDGAGLGGCLALDMGLGKTPTMLAHLRQTRERGKGLVIAPPAVVGNWASEAREFTPDLRVLVHHGTQRSGGGELEQEIADADVIITTYGTALRDVDELERITWGKVVLDEAQVIKNPASETAQQLRRLEAHNRVVLTGTPIENGLGDLWSLMDFVNPGLLGDRATFVAQMQKAAESQSGAESALRTLNGVLVFRRTKAEPIIAEELPDRIDALDHCPMTSEQIGLYQAVLDQLVVESSDAEEPKQRKGAILSAITALKQICNHPAAYTGDEEPLEGRSGKLARLEEIVDNVFVSGERMLIFTHFASWARRLADHLTDRTGVTIPAYHGGLARGARDRMIRDFQEGEGPGAMVLSLKAGGTGLNLTAASHVVLYDRWWNPAVEDQARDRVWRIGQIKSVVAHRLVCPGTVDERVEEVVAGKRRVADIVLPKSSSVGDLDSDQLRRALGIDRDAVLTDDAGPLPATRGDAA